MRETTKRRSLSGNWTLMIFVAFWRCVPSIVNLRRLLTFSFQAELAEKADADARNISNTHTNAPGLHQGIPNIETPEVRSYVLNAHDVVSGTHRDAVYPVHIFSQAWEDTVSGIPPRAHRNTFRNLGDADGRNRAVSTTCTLLLLSIDSQCIAT